METKAEVLLKRMERLYKNIYNLLEAFHYAANNQNQNITVELFDENNNTKKLPVNSFMQLQQEINRIDNNFKSLTTSPSYFLSGDGTLSQYAKTTFLTAEFIDNFDFDGTKCIIDKSSMLEDFVYPTIKLPIKIDNNILRSDIYCKVYEITSGWSNITDNPKEINLQYLKQNGKLSYQDYIRELKLEKQKVNYFGYFTIESVTYAKENNFTVILDKTNYTSKAIIGDTIALKPGDVLVSKSGNTKYQIVDLDVFLKTVNLVRIGGSEKPEVGINQLVFNEQLVSNNNVVNIPIKPNQKLVIFLSTENLNAISYPSVGIKIDTSDFTVVHEGITYTIDEYFQKYVTNFTEYLNTIVDNYQIPYSLGIKPNKPVLNINNFKVVQINKHLIDANTQNSLTELNKKKQQIQNEIDAKQLVINQTQSEIDSQNFNSVEEKTYRLNRMQSLRNDINVLKSNLLTITRDIDSNASKYGLKNLKPKYKVIGFWDVQDAIYSVNTPPQHIIKYEVQYRYLRKDIDVSETTSYKMISNGKEITVAFSDWNELQTRTLNKVKQEDGSFEWESNILDSINDININQCSITISEGESIEIKVRAVSEAGYPISPLKSEWSEPIRIDFPDSLKTNSLQATISQNNLDLSTAEFNALLQNLGLLNHISGTIKESEKTFFHSAKDIASGQYTVEQKNIPLDEVIKNILQDIKVLKSNDTNDNIVVSVVDFNNEQFVIKNGTTTELFAGNYTDEFELTDVNHFGDIIKKKCYIKIRNNNTVPVELRSLVPGKEFSEQTAYRYVNVPVLFQGKIKTDLTGNIVSDNTPLQSTRQIIYLRNIDVIGSKINEQIGNAYDLIYLQSKESDKADLTIPSNEDITNGNTILYLNAADNLITSEFKTNIAQIPYIVFKNVSDLNGNQEFLNYYKSLFKDITVIDSNNVEKTIKISKFSDILKKDIIQRGVRDINDLSEIQFTEYDKYAIGRNTVGAFLYPYLPDFKQILVDGNTSASSMIIPAESEILLPIIFEYRFTDALGNINGEVANNSESVRNELAYIKKIGFDLLINNSVFKFDLQVSAKLQSKISTIDMTSIKSNYRNENKETLI